MYFLMTSFCQCVVILGNNNLTYSGGGGDMGGSVTKTFPQIFYKQQNYWDYR